MIDYLMEKTVHQLRQSLQGKAPSPPGRTKRSIGLPEAFWSTGQTLRISFLGAPDEAFKRQIVDIGSQWLEHAQLNFALLDNDQRHAEIVIRTDGPETLNQSDYGRYRSDTNGETMTLGVKPADPNLHAMVLHEFGHALGLYHEHQHPDAGIAWDKAALRRYLSTRFSEEERAHPDYDEIAERLISQNYDPITYQPRITLRYDQKSIMHYPINNAYTVGDHASDWAVELSAKDKQFMRMIYPGKGSPDVT
jgi:hypothetical protein